MMGKKKIAAELVMFRYIAVRTGFSLYCNVRGNGFINVLGTAGGS